MRHLLGQFPLHVRESRGSMNIGLLLLWFAILENGLNPTLKNIDSSNTKHVEFGELQTAEGTWILDLFILNFIIFSLSIAFPWLSFE